MLFRRPKVSCIIPVFNEAKTVSLVAETVLKSRWLDEVIFINDGSSDETVQILEQFEQHPKCTVFSTSQNKGKGWAVSLGISEAKHDLVLLCDADLQNLKENHLKQLIETLKKHHCAMVIASRNPLEGRVARAFAWVSGERIFYRKNLRPEYLLLMKEAGNGMEQIINFVHRRKKVEFVVSNGVGHILKYQKGSWKDWSSGYAKESWQFLKTEAKLRRIQLKLKVTDWLFD